MSSFSPDTRALIASVCTPAQVDALRLKHEQGLGYRAIGLSLGISRDSARDRVRAAEAKLERAMREAA